MAAQIIRTGDVHLDWKDGGYIAIDSSWDSRGDTGRFTSGRLVSTGDALTLDRWKVEGWKSTDDVQASGFPVTAAPASYRFRQADRYVYDAHRGRRRLAEAGREYSVLATELPWACLPDMVQS